MTRTRLAPDLSTFTALTFHDHVSRLKRIPKRSASKPRKAPRLPTLKLKRSGPATLELSCGNALLVIIYETVKEGRKRLKRIESFNVEKASKLLLRPESAIRTFLDSKSIIIEETVSV